MGWFDGDSGSEDEEEATKKKPLLLLQTGENSSSTIITNHGDAAADAAAEEEEDPLDAYMKTLSDPSSTSRAAATVSTKKKDRLDWDNEDEATSHWQQPASSAAATSQTTAVLCDDLDDNELDQDGFVKSSAVAKRALQQTFHKAGGASASAGAGGRPSSQGDYNNNYSNEGDTPTSYNKQSKHIDIQLDQVDHNQMDYDDFEKVFWNPPAPPTSSTTTYNHQSSSSDQTWRQKHSITVQGLVDDVPPIYDFKVLKKVLEEPLLLHISKLGYQHPTPVQAQTLPVAMHGKDALITAPTGSGKTLAYVWPMVVHVCAQHHLAAHETGPIGLILVPTRELAQQVQKHVQSMLQPLGGTSLTIIGGMGKYPLTQHLRQKGGVEIVVATPGRLLDVLATKQQQQNIAASSNPSKKLQGLSLERTTMVVLDESDRLLHMGFTHQVTQILQNIRPNRQTLMLSATMSHRIENVAKQWMGGGGGGDEKGGIGNRNTRNTYVRIAVGRTGQASLHVIQHVMVVPSPAAKLSWLQQMLPVLCQVGRTLVFCASKAGCEELATAIKSKLPEDIQCVTLHGDKHQSDRNAALRKFVKQQRVVLIATDVASRGLDIPDVTTVVNFDPPKNLDVHVHRVGRAGRLSTSKNISTDSDSQQPNEGSAYTLLRTPKDADIGHVLLGAMEREDRPIPEELRQLAQLSRQHQGGGNSSDQSRNHWNKSGLGAAGASQYQSLSSGSGSCQNQPESSQGGGHYGPSSQQPPPEKKGRWS